MSLQNGGCETSPKSTLVFFVNGVKVEDAAARPEMTLLSYLRNTLGLCGTKLGCGEGGCGACTVMLSYYSGEEGTARHMSANACLTPLVSLHGMAVTTVEGIGSTKTKLHAVQERIAKSHGSQCGFCTPGIVMSMYTLLRNNPKPEMEDIETYFQGNLCRCTGYRPILEGFKTFTESWSASATDVNEGGGGGGGCSGSRDGICCMMVQNGTAKDGQVKTQVGRALFDPASFQPYDPTQEPIFPPELKLRHEELCGRSEFFRSERMKWYRPATLGELLALKAEHPAAKIVVGNTELGVEMKFKNCHYPVMIQPSRIAELNGVSDCGNAIKFGASVTLSRLEEECRDRIERMKPHKTRVLVQIVEMLRWFAGKQIRNVAAVGGNIMTGSPISDLNPIFMAAECALEVRSEKGGTRTVKMDGGFYTGYRRNVLAPDEILVSVSVPYTEEDEHFVAFKQAKRRDDDIAIVNSAFFFKLSGSGGIEVARMAFGGMAPTTAVPVKTMSFLVGRQWNRETFDLGCDSLLEDLPLPPGVPGAMVRYRRALTISFLFKAFLTVSRSSGAHPLPSDHESATEVFSKEPLKSHQLYEIRPASSAVAPVGRPIAHKSAEQQATGEAEYVDDMPRFENEAYLGLVLSSRSHAEIVSMDATAALEVEGVFCFLSAKDIPSDRNKYNIVPILDEEVFASEKVRAVGQPIAAIAARDQDTAQRAAKLVKVNYRELPAIVTIEEAIEAASFYPTNIPEIRHGNASEALKSSHHVISGSIRSGAQEHFYLETNAVVAVPNKEKEMVLYVSCQCPSDTQRVAAGTLGVEMNRVVCKVKRVGGGFGGKETRTLAVSTICAVAAEKLGRPVRIMLDRDEDMLITGHRHSFLSKYEVGFDAQGKILALDVDLYNNGGQTADLSLAVMERGITHVDNAYHIPNVHVKGRVCKTNLPSNTAFRGFGAPQAMFVAETIVDKIAVALKKDPIEVRRLNLYQEGDTAYCNMKMEGCTVGRCFEECLVQSRYAEQVQEVNKYNELHRWKKRGLAIIPTKYFISFGAIFLNQGGALVKIYKDGSVLVSHGGTEIGQGLHTKMIQVASQTLGVDHGRIHILETATDKVPNTSPTAASATSDLNGMAILNACTVLRDRLKPFRERMPGKSWNEWVGQAYFERVPLFASGFYATPDLDYDPKTNTGRWFDYATYGAGCSVVEIDCLTGDHSVLKTDIVMDLGESLNPAIDIGQIEGAFAQGYGLFMMEQLVHSPDGNLLTRGPGAYKIPGFGDIPSEFNVSLLRGANNPRAVYSSKAVGEPPLFLAASVFFATKSAIREARRASGIGNPDMFDLDAPATAERIRMACEDQFTQKVPQLPPDGSYKPWGIQI